MTYKEFNRPLFVNTSYFCLKLFGLNYIIIYIEEHGRRGGGVRHDNVNIIMDTTNIQEYGKHIAQNLPKTHPFKSSTWALSCRVSVYSNT